MFIFGAFQQSRRQFYSYIASLMSESFTYIYNHYEVFCFKSYALLCLLKVSTFEGMLSSGRHQMCCLLMNHKINVEITAVDFLSK